MIICHVRHGRTRRDADYLARHLLKAEGGTPAILHSITGLAAADVPGALHAMRRLAPAGRAAFHHVSLSPAGNWTANALADAASRVVRELGADPATHPHAIVVHRKPGPAGRGALHAHVVIAHWSGTGPGLRDGWSRLRLERLARELEFDAGETPTRGRHDRAIAKALRLRGHNAVADALDAVWAGPEPPRSPVTAAARQALQRRGIDDAAARRAVAGAWSGCDTPTSLRHALTDAGLQLERGEKPGVWIITTDAGVAIGALDRIVRRRRAEIATFMERDHADRIATVRGVDPARPEDRPQDRKVAPPSRPTGGTGGAAPAGPDPRSLDGHSGRAAEHPRQPASHRAGDPAAPRRLFRDRAAAAALASAISMTEIMAEVERRYLQRRLDELREVHDAACEKLALANVPLPMPGSLIGARTRADQARQASRTARNAAREANARLDAIMASKPRGFAILTAWIGGRARRLRQEAAEAAEAARRANDRHEGAERLVTVFQAALEAEADRAAGERVLAAASRRQLAEIAQHEVAVAIEAARMLRADPLLASRSVCDLLWSADNALRQQRMPATGNALRLPTYR